VGKKKQHLSRHIPQRTCIVCRQKFDKRRLTRIVRTPDEGVVVDSTGKRNGRGAYLCDRVICWEKALDDPQLVNKVLMTEVTTAERVEIATHKPEYGVVRE